MPDEFVTILADFILIEQVLINFLESAEELKNKYAYYGEKYTLKN